MSVDPLAEKYPSLSPYNYVANNPLAFVDSNGEYAFHYLNNGVFISVMSKSSAWAWGVVALAPSGQPIVREITNDNIFRRGNWVGESLADKVWGGIGEMVGMGGTFDALKTMTDAYDVDRHVGLRQAADEEVFGSQEVLGIKDKGSNLNVFLPIGLAETGDKLGGHTPGFSIGKFAVQLNPKWVALWGNKKEKMEEYLAALLKPLLESAERRIVKRRNEARMYSADRSGPPSDDEKEEQP